uniref:Uncharacterized protein n=1 Tax=Anguilla anguilla TaxID=7936 RepID=A0A0E9VJN0_ANGAN
MRVHATLSKQQKLQPTSTRYFPRRD